MRALKMGRTKIVRDELLHIHIYVNSSPGKMYFNEITDLHLVTLIAILDRKSMLHPEALINKLSHKKIC